MNGAEGGWRSHPDAVEPGRVVGLGAICDLGPQHPGGTGSQSFSVSEFATLENGRRVLLHEDRGFTIGWRSTGEPHSGGAPVNETRDTITQTVLTVVLPDDDECTEEHPWPWLAELARARGLDVTAEDLRGLPYEVVLTDAVTRWLAPPEAEVERD